MNDKEKNPSKMPPPAVIDVVDLNPQASLQNNNNGVGYNKLTRRLSNVSNAIQMKIFSTREEGNFTLGKLFFKKLSFLWLLYSVL